MGKMKCSGNFNCTYPLLQILSPVVNDRQSRASLLKQKSSKESWRVIGNFQYIVFLKQPTFQKNLRKLNCNIRFDHKFREKISSAFLKEKQNDSTDFIQAFLQFYLSINEKKKNYDYGYVMPVVKRKAYYVPNLSQEMR